MSDVAGEAPPQILTARQAIRQIKAYMKANDISYGELARAMGMEERSQISRWMNGRVEPRLSTIEKIQDGLRKAVKARKAK